MKLHEVLNTEKAEENFSAVLVLTVLVILPQLGGMAMLIGSIVGLAAYVAMFKDRLRARGWWRFAVTVAIACALGVAFAIVLR